MTLRLDTLTVSGFRGISGTETFQFGGENNIVVGPNGTGKSTIGQALEYLLTGQVSSFTGTATGRINKRTHLPNRRTDPVDVFVEARFVDESGSFDVRREFTSRGLEATRRPPEFKQLLDLADQGLLKLTREQLLDLVVSTPGDRKNELQALLNVEEIDTRRRQLKRLARKAEQEAESRERDRNRAADQVRDALDINSVTSDEIRTAVNELRDRLGGEVIEDIDSADSFRAGLSGPAEQASHPLQETSVRQALETVTDWLTTSANDFEGNLTEFAESVQALQSDKEALARLSEFELVEQGCALVDDHTARCPLCRAEYDQGELVPRLDARRRRLQRIEERVKAVQQQRNTLQSQIDSPIQSLRQLTDHLPSSVVGIPLDPLSELHEQLTAVENEFEHDMVNETESINVEVLSGGIEFDEPMRCARTLLAEAESVAPASELQQAWDALQTAEEGVATYQPACDAYRKYDQAATELRAAHEDFLAARDTILADVYETIAESFSHYYTQINPDEEGLGSMLTPTNTGVKFSVGFHDGGDHPPHALHSEGHQDSMGVCLFLALVEHFSPLNRTPIVLDDVVMSVDAGHRARVARLLEDLSTDFQFILTTHDKSWGKQLLDAEFVTSGNIVAFEDWSPEKGPKRVSSIYELRYEDE